MIAEYKLCVKRHKWIRIAKRIYVLARLIMHSVEEPVLPARGKKCIQRKHVHKWQTKDRCTDHSSVSHSQARSYFSNNEGSVPTMAYKRPNITHAFSWYGVWEKALFPAMSHVEAWSQKKRKMRMETKEEKAKDPYLRNSPIKKLRANPTSPTPIDTPHISVYSSSVYA